MSEWDEFQDEFAKQPMSSNKSTLPDGVYKVVIDSVDMGQGREAKPTFKWVMKVIEGDFSGQKITKTWYYKNQESFGHLKRDVAFFGEVPANLADLKAMMPKMLDKVLLIKKATNAVNGVSYDRVYFNKLLSGETEKIPF